MSGLNVSGASRPGSACWKHSFHDFGLTSTLTQLYVYACVHIYIYVYPCICICVCICVYVLCYLIIPELLFSAVPVRPFQPRLGKGPQENNKSSDVSLPYGCTCFARIVFAADMIPCCTRCFSQLSSILASCQL